MVPPRAETTRERILETALELFSEHGYAATTTRQITGRLEVTPAALYYHFRGKSACLRAVVEPYLDALEDLLDRHPEHVGTEADARAFLGDYLSLLVAHSAVAGLVDNDMAVAVDRRLGPRLDAVSQRLRLLLAGPDADDTARVRASAALGAIRRPVLRMPDTVKDATDVAIDAAVAALQFGTRRGTG